MGGRLSVLQEAQRAEAVREFDVRFGEMERALWCLSLHSRAGLLERRDLTVVETLVWTVKSWWGVQGVRSDTKALMARALLDAVDWSPKLFEDTHPWLHSAQRNSRANASSPWWSIAARPVQPGGSSRWPQRFSTGFCPTVCPPTTATSAKPSASAVPLTTLSRHTARLPRRYSAQHEPSRMTPPGWARSSPIQPSEASISASGGWAAAVTAPLLRSAIPGASWTGSALITAEV